MDDSAETSGTRRAVNSVSKAGIESGTESGTGRGADAAWIACELHDGLMQWVISSKMQVESLLGTLGPASSTDNETRESLELTRQALANAVDEGRQLMDYLQSGSEGEMESLPLLLSRYVARMKAEAASHGQSLQLVVEGAFKRKLGPETQWNLLRIAQQAIRNAIQHAGTCSIAIKLQESEQQMLAFEVVDDGMGFDPTSPSKPLHFGQASMKHRAQLIGATLELESKHDQGTVVRLELP